MIRRKIKPILSRLGLLATAKQVAFRLGYRNAETEMLAILGDTELLGRFRTGAILPDGFGVGQSERIVEYPWVFSQLREKTQAVLDAGSILNHGYLMSYMLEKTPLNNAKIYIITLGPEKRAFWESGISYIYDDLRSMPFRDAMFDTIICVSTLEHIGFDNVRYTQDPAASRTSPHEFTSAMCELWRTLQPGGQLLLTVPYGKRMICDWWQQFDNELLNQAIEAVGEANVTTVFFHYSASGWQISDAAACANAEYVSYYLHPPELRPKSRPEQPDGARAARAVACVRLEKP